MFVEACRLICSRAICHDAVTKMDELIIKFCKEFEHLYGALSCTPNLHLHCHLKQCVLDFGPAGSFWAFPYERLNGILGSVQTNHQAIEIQLMRKFCITQQVMQVLDNTGDNTLHELFKPFMNSKGSLKHEEIPNMPLQSSLSVVSIKEHSETCKLIPPIKEACLNADEQKLVDNTFQHCFGDAYVRTMLVHKFCRAAYFGGDLFGSLKSIHSNSALVYAKNNEGRCMPGFISKFLRVTVELKPLGEIEFKADIYLVAINWLEEHPEKSWFDPPIEVWSRYLPCSVPESYIPVSHVVAYLEDTIEFNHLFEEIVTVVIPIHNFYGLL